MYLAPIIPSTLGISSNFKPFLTEAQTRAQFRAALVLLEGNLAEYHQPRSHFETGGICRLPRRRDDERPRGIRLK